MEKEKTSPSGRDQGEGRRIKNRKERAEGKEEWRNEREKRRWRRGRRGRVRWSEI